MRIDLFRRSCRDVYVGVFLQVTTDGTHTGIVHRQRGQLFRLELLWHERLRADLLPPHRDYPVVIPNATFEELNDVRAMCRLITLRAAADPPRVPYALRVAKDTHFSSDGTFVLGGGLGLTCSSLVLKVFDASGVPLVETAHWPEREDDDDRHRQLVALMRTHGVPISHVAAVEEQLPCIRIRPEEVAGAGMAEPLPADFELARAAGEWLIEQVHTP